MYRYNVSLLIDEAIWSESYSRKNQIIFLFKRDQHLNKDLNYIFSNYENFDAEDKAYASSVADDLFSENEIKELMDLFGDCSESKIMIHGRVKLPFKYEHNCGISIIPECRRDVYVKFRDFKKLFLPKKLSFPLEGLMRMDRHLIDPRDLEDILVKKDISVNELKEKLLKL